MNGHHKAQLTEMAEELHRTYDAKSLVGMVQRLIELLNIRSVQQINKKATDELSTRNFKLHKE